MTGVAIRFRCLAGRFGATPWDRSPNEGIPEWPPAPWRVLRAIVAAAHRADGDPDAELLGRVLHALRDTPRYRLPLATAAHTRSYQPLFGYKSDTGRQETTLVLDAFVVVGRGAGDEDAWIVIEWPLATLTDEQAAALDRWLAALGYLGRAESWVEAERTTVDEREASAEPLDRVDAPAATVRLLTPGEGDAEALLQALVTGTDALFRQRLLDPPGTRWVDYAFRMQPFAAPPHRSPRPSGKFARNTFVRLAIGGRVLPRLTDAVRFGDRVRAALMGRSRGDDGWPHPVFAGKTRGGDPLRDNAHMHVLPLDEDRDGGIDHILLWAPAGFDEPAMEAIAGFAWIRGAEGFDLRIAITGMGGAGISARQLGVPRQWERHCAVTSAALWRSRTPFVLPRHPKVRRGELVDGPEEQLRRELNRLGMPAARSIRALEGTKGASFIPWHRFRLTRATGGGSRGSDRGFGFEVEFEGPVQGPIAVGYGARQGLGQFEPVND